ncbi:MAG: GNAT family N-acetyltransferase [Candidatus Bathyarchaeota archaeon]|nr:GNAT family N-acetyltransferase [Candidatus Bathyarchaeota archaeon]
MLLVIPVNMEPQHRSIIRPANRDDLEAISAIEQKCFPEPIAYSKRQLAYLVLNANSASFVETLGNVIRGFVIVTYRRGSPIGHIETIDVDPAHTKKGIGLKLLTRAEDDMRKKGKRWSQLEVSENNKAAIGLYKKAGYTLKEKINRYYRYEHEGTRDALRMVKAL